jgi:hypothetical protein
MDPVLPAGNDSVAIVGSSNRENEEVVNMLLPT